MCTLIVLHRLFDGTPLLVAANRDEYLDRPAEGPGLRRVGDRTILAPRDLRAGGTWLGLNDAGVFAALTNRPCPGSSPNPGHRSRGLVVEDALRAGSAGQAAEAAAALPAASYNPFNLFVSDGEEAFSVIYEGKPQPRRLGPGVHVVGNADPDDRSVPKVARLLDEAERVAAAGVEGSLDGLAALCRAHDAGDGPLADTCIHAGGYGTRSSTLLRRGSGEDGNVLRYAAGAPCRTEYEDLTPLLDELGWKAGVRGRLAQRNVA